MERRKTSAKWGKGRPNLETPGQRMCERYGGPEGWRQLDHWQRAVGSTQTLDRKFGRGWAGRRRGETAPDGPGGIHQGLESHFPGGASLPPPRDPAGREAHIWRSWTTYPGAWEPVGVSSCQAGVPVRAGWKAGTEEGGGGGGGRGVEEAEEARTKTKD